MRCLVGAGIEDRPAGIVVQQGPIAPHRDRLAIALLKSDVAQGAAVVVELADKGVVSPDGFRGKRQKIGPLRTVEGGGVDLIDQTQDNGRIALQHGAFWGKLGPSPAEMSSKSQ